MKKCLTCLFPLFGILRRWYPWSVIRYFFAHELCQRPPCMTHMHSFIRILHFPAEAHYSYFSVDLRRKLFLWIFLNYSLWHPCFRVCLVFGWCQRRGAWGPIRNRKTAQKIAKNRKTASNFVQNRIKLPTHKAFVVFRISRSVLNFNTYKLILISEVLSGYFLLSAEHILA